MKRLLTFILFSCMAVLYISGCSKSDGVAPSNAFSSISISPAAVIAPKSTTMKISILGSHPYTDITEDITSRATCTTSNALASVDANGNLSNNYSGTSIQRLTVTCTYDGLSKSADITIVPATLTSLVLTKTNLQMGLGQSQSIKVYGNFTDVNSYVFALDLTNYVTWSTTNASVSMAVAGTVSSGNAGSANITASFSSQTVSTSVTVSGATSTPSASPRGVGLLGSYYDFGIANPSSVPWNSGTIGDPFERLFGQRIDSQVYFNWSTGVNNLGQPYYFGIRWTGKIYIPTTGSYTFYTNTDDGVKLWIGDLSPSATVINNWTLHANTENTSSAINLTGGQFYDIQMDYFENAGYSTAELRWQGPSITKQLIPQIYLFPE